MLHVTQIYLLDVILGMMVRLTSFRDFGVVFTSQLYLMCWHIAIMDCGSAIQCWVTDLLQKLTVTVAPAGFNLKRLFSLSCTTPSLDERSSSAVTNQT